MVMLFVLMIVLLCINDFHCCIDDLALVVEHDLALADDLALAP